MTQPWSSDRRPAPLPDASGPGPAIDDGGALGPRQREIAPCASCELQLAVDPTVALTELQPAEPMGSGRAAGRFS